MDVVQKLVKKTIFCTKLGWKKFINGVHLLNDEGGSLIWQKGKGEL